MRLATIATGLIATGTATGALAHPGHLAAAGGHDHWSLIGGLAVLALAGIVVVVRRRA